MSKELAESIYDGIRKHEVTQLIELLKSDATKLVSELENMHEEYRRDKKRQVAIYTWEEIGKAKKKSCNVTYSNVHQYIDMEVICGRFETLPFSDYLEVAMQMVQMNCINTNFQDSYIQNLFKEILKRNAKNAPQEEKEFLAKKIKENNTRYFYDESEKIVLLMLMKGFEEHEIDWEVPEWEE